MDNEITVSAIQTLEARIAELEHQIADLRALKQGPPGEAGRDGKDGRDGRDGKSINAPRLLSLIRSALSEQRLPPIYVEAAAVQQIVVQPTEVTLEAQMPAGGAPVVETHVHMEGVESLAAATDELRKTLSKPVRPLFQNGKLVGVTRDPD